MSQLQPMFNMLLVVLGAIPSTPMAWFFILLVIIQIIAYFKLILRSS